MKVEKEYYNSVRKKYKDPIHIMHQLYNSYCDANMRVPSMLKFQAYLTAWYAKKNVNLITGCLTTLKVFDSKFAQ